MPSAHGAAGKKYWLQDYDTAYVDPVPLVAGAWYEVFHDYDVRLLWCMIVQTHDEEGPEDLEVRWTIDGNVYTGALSCNHAAYYWVYRYFAPSGVGADELVIGGPVFNAAYYIDKRGLDFKVEVRQTSAVGTNAHLRAYCVYETLEET